MSQDLNARWSGEMIQVFSEDETFAWRIEANILQKGKRVSVKMVSVQTGKKNYSIAKFSGSIKNGKLKLSPEQVVKIDYPDPNYQFICFRNYKGELIVDELNNTLVIEADSYGLDIKYDLMNEMFVEGSCRPATFRLTKKNNITDHEGLEERVPDTSSTNSKEDIVLVDEKEIKVFSKTVKLKIWDSYDEDGDLINLYLNGDLLFTNLRVSREGEFFDIELNSGENTIQVEALNEGTVSPNTSAVTIFVNNQEHDIILSAKKGESDSLKIVVD